MTNRLDRPPRLNHHAYEDEHAFCLATTCVEDRRRVFEDARLAQVAVDVIADRAKKTGVRVYAYCVMPDHLHIVLSPSETCSIIDFIGGVKSLIARRSWPLGYSGSFWQTRFHDRFVRREEGWWATTVYVLNNPVKAGLVEEWKQYPWSGSIELPELRAEE